MIVARNELFSAEGSGQHHFLERGRVMPEFLRNLFDSLGPVLSILLVAAAVIAVPFVIIWLVKLIRFLIGLCIGRGARKKAAGCFVPPQAARRSVGRAEHAEILISAEEEAERERLICEADEELARRKAEALAEAASSAE